jgi:zinc transport system ATP-binding protein
MSAEQKQLMCVKDLAYSYGSVPVFSNLEFSIHAGEYICLVGANGSGKTTLLKHLVGLLKPAEGAVIRNIGMDEISYLPQTAHGTEDFPASVQEVILSARQNLAGSSLFYSKEDRQTLNEVAELLEITPILRKKIGEISGGQRRRVEIACAIARRPKLFILDEPFAGLDPEISDALHSILEDINESGSTIVLSSHDIGFVRRHASRVLELDGSIVYDGSPRKWHGLREKTDSCESHEYHDHTSEGFAHKDCAYCEHLAHHLVQSDNNCVYCDTPSSEDVSE